MGFYVTVLALVTILYRNDWNHLKREQNSLYNGVIGFFLYFSTQDAPFYHMFRNNYEYTLLQGLSNG